MDDNNSIGEIVRKMESNYLSGESKISKYVIFNLNENIEKIYAYLNSVPVSGKYDANNDEKPFINIVVSARNIWMRATDIDTSWIKIRPTTSKQFITALVATTKVQDWMKKTFFANFLNDWGRILAGYGSCITKTVRNSDGLHLTTIPWNSIICDAVDFDANPKIEILELTEGELRRRVKTHKYDKKAVEELIGSQKTRETISGVKKDSKSDYYKLYEIHGELSKYLLTDKDKDKDEFVQQMHVISYVSNGSNNKEYDDFTLVQGQEDKDPYRITHLIKEDGRSQSIGSVESLFQTQWMENHSILAQKKQLDLASKLFFQTSDPKYVSVNVINDIENGDILHHTLNQPLTQVNNGSHDISSLQNFSAYWKSRGNETVGISEAMLGASAKSGTAWRQTKALLNESYNLFKLMTQNKSNSLKMMFREDIIPFIKETELNNSKEIEVILDAYDIKQFDTKYLTAEANRRFNDSVIESALTDKDMPMMEAVQAQVQGELNDMGDKRFLKPSEVPNVVWKEMLKDIEWELDIDITGEAKDTQEAMATLNTALQTVMIPGYAQNEEAKMIVAKILGMTGVISPLELTGIQGQPAQAPQPAQVPQVGAGIPQ